MTTILAFDTSQDSCSVALIHNDRYFCASEKAAQSHTKRILPMIDELLNEAGCSKSQLEAVAFSQGPGSFTGLRIGFGIAQGLAMGLDIPVLPISSLKALALGAARQLDLNESGTIVATIDARMSEVYICHFSVNQDGVMPLAAEQVISPDDYLTHLSSDSRQISGEIIVGSGLSYDELSQEYWASQHPEFSVDAQDILTLAENDFARGLAQSITQVQPIYLRDTVSWQKRQKKRPQ